MKCHTSRFTHQMPNSPSKTRVLNALKLQPVDRVPFVETRVDPALQEALLGHPVDCPIEIEGTTILASAEINERLGLDNFQVRFLPPIATSDGRGGYMISSANSLTSYCKPENVSAMAAAIRKHRAR